MCKKNKSVWDACSTAHVSISGKVLAALSVVANQNGVSQSKVVQMLLYESKTLNSAIDELEAQGLFDPSPTRYEDFLKKKTTFLK